MPDPQHIEQVFAKYAEGQTANDADAVMKLFAADAVVRDPIDGPRSTVPRRSASSSSGAGIVKRLSLSGPVRVAADGVNAAAPIRAELDFGDGPKVLDAIDVFTFGDDGLITSMTAYYGPTNFNDA